jgi:dihydroorotase
MIVISGARTLTSDGWQTCDVAIEGATVAAVGAVAPAPDDVVIDGAGKVLGPGFVDLHTHLRDPGQTWKEDMESGTRSAARGGFTAVLAMPNTEPAVDSGEMVRRCNSRATDSGVVEVGFSGALSMGRAGEDMAHLDEMYEEGVRIFTDDGDTLADGGLLRRIMLYLGDRSDAVIAQHAEDRAIAGNGHMHEGARSQTLGLVGLPASAEVAVIARDLALVTETRARYHVQHISTAGAVALVRDLSVSTANRRLAGNAGVASVSGTPALSGRTKQPARFLSNQRRTSRSGSLARTSAKRSRKAQPAR